MSVATSAFCVEGGQAVLPAQFDVAELGDALDQKAFDVKLLDVDEGRLLGEVVAALLLAQVEAVDLVVAGEGAADAPLDAFGGDAVVDTEALEDFERFLGVADAAGRGALDADGVVFVEQDGGGAQFRERAGEGEAGDAAADDDDGGVFLFVLPPSSGGGAKGYSGSW